MEDIHQIEDSKLRNLVYRRLGSQYKIPNLRKYINLVSKECGSRPCTLDEFITKVEMIIRTSPTAKRSPKEERMNVEKQPRRKRQASPPSEIDQLAQLFGNVGINEETQGQRRKRAVRTPTNERIRMELDKREPTRRSQRNVQKLEPIIEETQRKVVKVVRKRSSVRKMKEVKPEIESPVDIKEEEPKHKLERRRTSSSSSEGRENKKINRRDESALLRSLLKMGF